MLAGCALLLCVVRLSGLLAYRLILVALAAGLLAGAMPYFWARHKRGKRLDQFQEGLPEALDLMVNALRAGHSLIAAMGSVARECADPIGCEFKACFEEQNYGLEMKTALDNMINRIPPPGSAHRRHRDHDPEGERRKPCRGTRQDLPCDP
jgi:Flp pilus assembly protein TadB